MPRPALAKAEMANIFRRMGAAMTGPLRMHVKGTVAEGDKVAVEAVSRGELRNGRVYAQEYHVLFTVRDGAAAAGAADGRAAHLQQPARRMAGTDGAAAHSGVSVAELRRYTVPAQGGAAHLEELRDLLAAHRQRLHDRMAELQRAQRLIDEKINFYSAWIDTGERPEPDRRRLKETP